MTRLISLAVASTAWLAALTLYGAVADAQDITKPADEKKIGALVKKAVG